MSVICRNPNCRNYRKETTLVTIACTIYASYQGHGYSDGKTAAGTRCCGGAFWNDDEDMCESLTEALGMKILEDCPTLTLEQIEAIEKILAPREPAKNDTPGVISDCFNLVEAAEGRK